MSLALCSSCQRFARPFARCPFCNAPTAAPLPRPKKRGTRDSLLAATAILIACGGTSSPDDGGSGGDAAQDAKADVTQMADSGGGMDAGNDSAADAAQDVAEEDNWTPPPPYGSPPIPRRRIV